MSLEPPFATHGRGNGILRSWTLKNSEILWGKECTHVHIKRGVGMEREK